MFHKIFSFALFALLVTSSASLAQIGFHGGLRAAHASISWDDTSFDENNEKGTGPGVGVSIGYGFNPLLTMMVSLSSHTLNGGDAYTHYAEIVSRFHLGKKSIQPYLEAGVMGSIFRYDDIDVRFSGPGFTAGGGVRAAFSDRIGMELGVRPTRSFYNKVKSGRQSADIDAIKTWQLRSYIGLSIYID